MNTRNPARVMLLGSRATMTSFLPRLTRILKLSAHKVHTPSVHKYTYEEFNEAFFESWLGSSTPVHSRGTPTALRGCKTSHTPHGEARSNGHAQTEHGRTAKCPRPTGCQLACRSQRTGPQPHMHPASRSKLAAQTQSFWNMLITRTNQIDLPGQAA